jgi:hypothetical protein
MNKKEKIIKKKKKILKEDKNNKNIKNKKPINKKIILETSADLYKLPISTIKNTKLYNFTGKYYEQMYKELLKAEKNGVELQFSNLYNNPVNKKEVKINKIIIRIIYPFYKNVQMLGILGSIKELGNWNQENALKMEYDEEDNIWQKEFLFNKKEDFEYKFIFMSKGNVIKWEDGNNRIFKYSYIKKLIEINLEDGMAHLEEENKESFDYDLNEELLLINCQWKFK